MDAFIHAFEASTNRYAHDGARGYGHSALRLCLTALPDAWQMGMIEARQKMLLASAWAGAAIDQVGTAVAHHISHAMASKRLFIMAMPQRLALGDFRLDHRWHCG